MKTKNKKARETQENSKKTGNSREPRNRKKTRENSSSPSHSSPLGLAGALEIVARLCSVALWRAISLFRPGSVLNLAWKKRRAKTLLVKAMLGSRHALETCLCSSMLRAWICSDSRLYIYIYVYIHMHLVAAHYCKKLQSLQTSMTEKSAQRTAALLVRFGSAAFGVACVHKVTG